jgi:hypothetical protein
VSARSRLKRSPPRRLAAANAGSVRMTLSNSLCDLIPPCTADLTAALADFAEGRT